MDLVEIALYPSFSPGQDDALGPFPSLNMGYFYGFNAAKFKLERNYLIFIFNQLLTKYRKQNE